MRVSITGDRKTVALLLLCGLLMLTILVQVTLMGPANTATAAESAEASFELPESVATPFDPRPLDDYSEILERPLMFADRRMPAEPEVTAEPAQPRSPLRLKLEGVAISADSRVALLRNTADNQLLQLAEGTAHDSWTLEALSTSSATFRRGEDITEIVLEVKARDQRRN